MLYAPTTCFQKKQKEKASKPTWLPAFPMAESEGFEPSCDFTRNSISSRARYDHFDTSPNLSQHQDLGKRGELMGRTEKNIKLKIPEKLRKIKDFRLGGYRIATTISS